VGLEVVATAGVGLIPVGEPAPALRAPPERRSTGGGHDRGRLP
jgi:hypothetical protein